MTPLDSIAVWLIYAIVLLMFNYFAGFTMKRSLVVIDGTSNWQIEVTLDRINCSKLLLQIVEWSYNGPPVTQRGSGSSFVSRWWLVL